MNWTLARAADALAPGHPDAESEAAISWLRQRTDDLAERAESVALLRALLDRPIVPSSWLQLLAWPSEDPEMAELGVAALGHPSTPPDLLAAVARRPALGRGWRRLVETALTDPRLPVASMELILASREVLGPTVLANPALPRRLVAAELAVADPVRLLALIANPMLTADDERRILDVLDHVPRFKPAAFESVLARLPGSWHPAPLSTPPPAGAHPGTLHRIARDPDTPRGVAGAIARRLLHQALSDGADVTAPWTTYATLAPAGALADLADPTSPLPALLGPGAWAPLLAHADREVRLAAARAVGRPTLAR